MPRKTRVPVELIMCHLEGFMTRHVDAGLTYTAVVVVVHLRIVRLKIPDEIRH